MSTHLANITKQMEALEDRVSTALNDVDSKFTQVASMASQLSSTQLPSFEDGALTELPGDDTLLRDVNPIYQLQFESPQTVFFSDINFQDLIRTVSDNTSQQLFKNLYGKIVALEAVLKSFAEKLKKIDVAAIRFFRSVRLEYLHDVKNICQLPIHDSDSVRLAANLTKNVPVDYAVYTIFKLKELRNETIAEILKTLSARPTANNPNLDFVKKITEKGKQDIASMCSPFKFIMEEAACADMYEYEKLFVALSTAVSLMFGTDHMKKNYFNKVDTNIINRQDDDLNMFVESTHASIVLSYLSSLKTRLFSKVSPECFHASESEYLYLLSKSQSPCSLDTLQCSKRYSFDQPTKKTGSGPSDSFDLATLLGPFISAVSRNGSKRIDIFGPFMDFSSLLTDVESLSITELLNHLPTFKDVFNLLGTVLVGPTRTSGLDKHLKVFFKDLGKRCFLVANILKHYDNTVATTKEERLKEFSLLRLLAEVESSFFPVYLSTREIALIAQYAKKKRISVDGLRDDDQTYQDISTNIFNYTHDIMTLTPHIQLLAIYIYGLFQYGTVDPEFGSKSPFVNIQGTLRTLLTCIDKFGCSAGKSPIVNSNAYDFEYANVAEYFNDTSTTNYSDLFSTYVYHCIFDFLFRLFSIEKIKALDGERHNTLVRQRLALQQSNYFVIESADDFEQKFNKISQTLLVLEQVQGARITEGNYKTTNSLVLHTNLQMSKLVSFTRGSTSLSDMYNQSRGNFDIKLIPTMVGYLHEFYLSYILEHDKYQDQDDNVSFLATGYQYEEKLTSLIWLYLTNNLRGLSDVTDYRLFRCVEAESIFYINKAYLNLTINLSDQIKICNHGTIDRTLHEVPPPKDRHKYIFVYSPLGSEVKNSSLLADLNVVEVDDWRNIQPSSVYRATPPQNNQDRIPLTMTTAHGKSFMWNLPYTDNGWGRIFALFDSMISKYAEDLNLIPRVGFEFMDEPLLAGDHHTISKPTPTKKQSLVFTYYFVESSEKEMVCAKINRDVDAVLRQPADQFNIYFKPVQGEDQKTNIKQEPAGGAGKKRKSCHAEKRRTKIYRAHGPTDRAPLQMSDIMLMFSEPMDSLNTLTDIVDTPFYNSEYFSDAVVNTAASIANTKLPKDYKNPLLIIRAKMKAISQQMDVFSVASTNSTAVLVEGLSLLSDWTLLKWIECAACQHFHKHPSIYFLAKEIPDEYKTNSFFYNIDKFQTYFVEGDGKSRYSLERFYKPLIDLITRLTDNRSVDKMFLLQKVSAGKTSRNFYIVITLLFLMFQQLADAATPNP